MTALTQEECMNLLGSFPQRSQSLILVGAMMIFAASAHLTEDESTCYRVGSSSKERSDNKDFILRGTHDFYCHHSLVHAHS